MTQVLENTNTRTMTMAAAITDAMDVMLSKDPSVVMYGEDVGNLGGVYRITTGLQKKHGEERVFDSPLTESGIIGTAIGAAALGMRPVVELQFGGFMMPAFDQIFSHVSRFRYRSRGRWKSPLVVRFPVGGGLGLLEQHADSPEAYLMHTPGIKVAYPSNPVDAKGLLISAIEDDDPVFFFETIKLYRDPSLRTDVPSGYYNIPLGKARVAREGKDVTIISYGGMIQPSLAAAEAAAGAGISCEVIDLRTIVPLDIETILESVAKTGRVVIVHEAAKTGGVGAEIATQIMEKAFYELVAPIERVCSFDTMPSPFNSLNHFSRPEAHHVAAAIKKVLSA
ncbi:MAG: alpha-ketoacid dehydrogenase subunit beta [Deinococcales bacterium]